MLASETDIGGPKRFTIEQSAHKQDAGLASGRPTHNPAKQCGFHLMRQEEALVPPHEQAGGSTV